MRPGRARQDRGFTLVELMVTVAMIIVLVIVTIPPVMKAVREREVADAAQAVMDILDFAKVQAAARNRAYQVVPTLTTGQWGPGKQGTIQLNEGPSSACINFASGVQNVRRLDFGQDYESVHLVSVTPADIVQATICIKPDGRVLRVDTQMPVASSDTQYAAGDVRFVVQRYEHGPTVSNGPVGIQHVIVLPYNGAARHTWQ